MLSQVILGLLVALVTGTALHEAGHYAALRACGLRPWRWHVASGRSRYEACLCKK